MTRLCVGAVLVLTALSPARSLQAQGIALTGVGPVNRSMGGAGTAAPLDAIGALHWNPGSISALQGNEIGFGTELLSASITLSSDFTGVGGGAGSTNADAGWAAVPSIGWVHHLDGTPMTIGLGVYGVAGFKNNMPFDAANPVLSNAGPFAGIGPAFGSAEILQITPTLSYQLTDRLSVGLSPTITTETVVLDPLGPPVTTAVTDAQGNRMHWGGGFQVGAYYRSEYGINAGATFKSKQWIETLDFQTAGGRVTFNLDYPAIVSLGLSYTGMENWTFAIDGRYFDYEHTDGYRELGWRSVFAGAVGIQYRATDRLSARFGYNFNQDPIQSSAVATNLISPLIQDMNFSTGATYMFTNQVALNLAYVYLVNNSVTGPIGPGTISNEISAHSLLAGVSVKY
jgi:long-chain fatty acid transport protein